VALSIKPGVRLLGLKPEILVGLQVAEGVYAAHGWTLRLTCGGEGKHQRASLHYAGEAVDLGLPPSGTDLPAFIEELKTALCEEFDALLEADHVHVEYQPKGQ
jgi:hypothetical protein